MIDKMNEITQFSPFAGQLCLESVPGEISGRREAENEAYAGIGQPRDMYVYAPKSGCPDSKQNQVLMVLRDGNDLESAKEVMARLKLDTLAEEKNFLLIFPNAQSEGWNYANKPSQENDMDYLVRCFAALRQSNVGVNGFNGMVFYVADSSAASAMLMTFCALRPLNVPAIMISQFPNGYVLPSQALHEPVAAWSSNPEATGYLMAANRADTSYSEESDGVTTYYGRENPNIRLLVTDRKTDAQTVRLAWERLFSETRRWQNDTYGTYQARPNFTEKGFVAHVNDTSLGVNNGFAHTWYEYIPPQLRNSKEKVPLVFYFHGGGCVPLYGAEQSCWHDIADEENFIVVYPKASQNAAWNAWNDPSLISDEAFMLALIEHMKTVHPIDERRIYVSGFSMGAMMSNAMACAHPELLAAAAPCNAYNEGYFSTYSAMQQRRKFASGSVSLLIRKFDQESSPSPVRLEADAKKASMDYRMPIFQISGLLDQKWPITTAADRRLDTFNYWKKYNNISITELQQNPLYESGLSADETCYEGDDHRFLHHRWFSQDKGQPALYELLLAKRMPHALDLRAPRYAWTFMKKFSRNPDGTLNIEESERT